jgi:hypothetical protein
LDSGLEKARTLVEGKPEFPHFQRLFSPSFPTTLVKEIHSSGYVIDTLEASLWCLYNTRSYQECILTAVNLGDDTDTTASVLAGWQALPTTAQACRSHGSSGLPAVRSSMASAPNSPLLIVLHDLKEHRLLLPYPFVQRLHPRGEFGPEFLGKVGKRLIQRSQRQISRHPFQRMGFGERILIILCSHRVVQGGEMRIVPHQFQTLGIELFIA